jgi:hypothetical protein
MWRVGERRCAVQRVFLDAASRWWWWAAPARATNDDAPHLPFVAECIKSRTTLIRTTCLSSERCIVQRRCRHVFAPIAYDMDRQYRV